MTTRHQEFSVAIIGVSGYASCVLRSLLAVLDQQRPVRLVAATVINPSEERPTCMLLESTGCRLFSDYRDMLDALAGRLDLCLIPTGIPWHAEMACHALAAGAHVLVEKPLAGCLADANRILEAAQAARRWVAVSFQDMYIPETHRLQKLLQDGVLGKLRRIAVRGSWPRGRDYYHRNAWAGRIHYQGRPTYDSPLNNAFAHFVNLGLFFAASSPHACASPRKLKARLLRCYPIESFDSAYVEAVTDGHVDLSWSFTHADPVEVTPQFLFEAEDGRVEWSYCGETLVTRHSDNRRWRWANLPPEALRRCMLNAVLQNLAGASTPACPASLTLAHAALISHIHARFPIHDFHTPDLLEDARAAHLWQPVPGIFDTLHQLELPADEKHPTFSG